MTCPRSQRKPNPEPRFQSSSPANALVFKSTLSSSTQSEKKYCRNLKFKLFATWRAAHVLALLSVYVERLQDITYIDSILNGNNHHNRFTVWQCLPVCYSNSNDFFFFPLIKRSRFLVPLATFWIFLFLGRSNLYPQCFIRERSHLVLLYCTRQVLPGRDSVFEGTIWLSCCQCHVAATHGQIGDALGGHSQQTSAVSWEKFSSSAARSA